ncbi:DPP IV N-terminal domain-containing protein [Mariniblastus fucicola]|nr:DPP IV N-terminal domain-containing protein [Mariniblastus fucicola]
MTQNPTASAQDSKLASLQTVAESSGFTKTSTSAEVESFIEEVTSVAPHVSSHSIGKTTHGNDIVCVTVSSTPYTPGDEVVGKNIVLVIGNIHSGECAGKEALLRMIRELGINPNSNWLEKNVLLFVPNYSADANDQMGPENRPGQVGPEIMGRRANPQRLDLNRDFVKLEAPETRALVGLINKANPHLFIDCHTTNGSKHRYPLTYDIPHNPATSQTIRSWLRKKMMPEVTRRLEESGTSTFYYGNFSPDHTKWVSFGHQPRYSTEYVGMRGRLAILSEAYSYATYEERIEATHAFVSTILDFMTENAEFVDGMLNEVDADLIETATAEPERIQVSLSASPEAFDEKFNLKGYKGGQPQDYECDFVSNYKSVTSTTLPWAWIVPTDQPRAIDRLLRHGIVVSALTEAKELQVEQDTVLNIKRSESEFQKHANVRIETERKLVAKEVPAGSYVVQSAQPLGRLAAYLLEAESDDGLTMWNFFDDSIAKGKPYPVVRLASPIALASKQISKVAEKLPISLDMLDGPSSLFARTPKSPKWFGETNLISDQRWGRSVVVDCETNAVVKPAAPFVKAKFAETLKSLDLETSVVSKLLSASPTNSTNGKVSILSASNHTVVYFIAADESMLIGSPDNEAELTVLNPAEDQLAFVNDDGLNFLNLDIRTISTVKKANKDNLVGKLDWVYQEELYGRGNFKGFWWHPEQDRVAFLDLDESPVLPFTVMDHLPVRGKSEFTNYPKAGDPLPKVRLGLVETDKPDEVTWIDLDGYDDELLISAVSWSQTGDRLVAQVQNREQTWLDFVTADADGKNVKAIFRDQTAAWIESPGDPIFVDDSTFLWVSPRNGYRHLYRYSLNGTMQKQLTAGEWEIRNLIGLDKGKQFCFFTAAKNSPLEIHLYRLDLASGEIRQLSQKTGSHQINFSADKQFYLDTWSDFLTMPQTSIHRNDGTLVRKLDVSSDDRFDFIEVAKPKLIEIPTDNQPMDGMLILPPNFDKSKKYPLFVHMYAGPQAPRVKNRFGGQWYLWHQMLAQKGYAVFIVDPRSCSHRSGKQAWPVFRNFATAELDDILTSIDFVKKEGWVDEDRIGIWGWSYGGYMTAFAMTHSDVFKMGISGAPVTDWKNYDAIYTERYMGLPQDNTEGYKTSSVLESAENLSGKMLLVHGTIDDNVHLNNTLQLVELLQKAGKQFDLMLYPSNRHSVRDKEQLKHLRKLMTDYVLENL